MKCTPEEISCAIDQLTHAVQHSGSFWGDALPTLLATFVGAAISALVTWLLFRKERANVESDRTTARDQEQADRYLERLTAGSARVIEELGVLIETMQTSSTQDQPGTGKLWSATAQLRMLSRDEDVEVAKEIERVSAGAMQMVWDSQQISYVRLMNEIQRWRNEGDDPRLRKELKALPYGPKDPKYT